MGERYHRCKICGVNEDSNAGKGSEEGKRHWKKLGEKALKSMKRKKG